ncbi:MAG: outer membrane protein OmpA-like peptidoglycan-associated protein [Sphingobacteriales bacterium]|jgi:outer membrane protein OmpA-like peptidoglycan-associated protein/tetratricopeptide (TPR) repeat protein
MIKKCLLTLLFLLVSSVLFAQQTLYIGNNFFSQLKYGKAIPYYLDAYKRNPSLDVCIKLGDCYRFLNKNKNAEECYIEALEYSNCPSEVVYYYGLVLKNARKYKEAKEQFLKYSQEVPAQEKRMKYLAESCDSSITWLSSPRVFELRNLSRLNSNLSDISPFKYGDQLLFTSNRGFEGVKEKSGNVYDGLGTPYFKVYVAGFENDTIVSVDKFSKFINNKYHNGPVSLTSKKDTIYFTRTNLDRNDKNKVNKLEIFFSTKDSLGNWSEAMPFRYNNPYYSVGHPAISPDGKYLIFSSDKSDDNFGGFDLFICKKLGNDWGPPKNLGSKFNTVGNENFPFISADYGLFFSSTDLTGLGGLDIFLSKSLNNGSWDAPLNLRPPINSPKDDFGIFAFNDSLNIGYLSSNRPGGNGEDDIYEFKKIPIEEPIPLVYKLFIKVFERLDNGEKVILNDVVKKLTNLPDTSVFNTELNSEGRIYFILDKFGPFNLKLSKNSYFTRNEIIYKSDLNITDTVSLDLNLDLELELELELERIVLNKEIVVKDIYYDFNKSNIRPDAEVQLDVVFKMLNDNPGIKIQIGSHTDSRGSDAYNLKLSQKRAESAVEYIVSQGINNNRITAKGFGETELRNKCINGIKCPEEDHEYNRRTEFRVTGFIPNTTIIIKP